MIHRVDGTFCLPSVKPFFKDLAMRSLHLSLTSLLVEGARDIPSTSLLNTNTKSSEVDDNRLSNPLGTLPGGEFMTGVDVLVTLVSLICDDVIDCSDDDGDAGVYDTGGGVVEFEGRSADFCFGVVGVVCFRVPACFIAFPGLCPAMRVCNNRGNESYNNDF